MVYIVKAGKERDIYSGTETECNCKGVFTCLIKHCASCDGDSEL